MSRYNDNPLMEPIFFTPPRGADRRMPLYKGGGGGGSVYYGNQDKLLGVQADIAQNMYNVYADYAPNRLQAMDKMVNEAMDGTLADRARSTAAADAGASLGTSLAGAQRSLERYGTTLNPNALNANLTNTALSEGAVRAGAMNRAQQWAEGQKWARNSDMYGALQGLPGNATQALGQAASGYGQMAGQQNQVNMANAMGYGQMGGMIGYGLFARDGGYIHEGEVVRRDDEPGYFSGGQVGGLRDKFRGIVNDAANVVGPGAGPMKGVVNSGVGQIYGSALFADGGYVGPDGANGYAMGGMPKLNDWRSYPTTQQSDTGTPSPVGQVASGLAPALGMYATKNYVAPYVKQGLGALKEGFSEGVSALRDGTTGAWEAGKAGVENYFGANQMDADMAALAKIRASQDAGTATTAVADTAGTAAADVAGTAAADVAGTAAADVAGTAALDAGVNGGAALANLGATAGTTAGATTAGAAGAGAAGAGAGLATAASAALPILGAGLAVYGIGSALDWWADGGPVPKEPVGRGLRKDMRPGGKVAGPGTETSDSIPAWLSDGEYVINAEAVKEVGKEKLEKINQKGLKKRKAKAKAAAPKATGIKKPVKK